MMRRGNWAGLAAVLLQTMAAHGAKPVLQVWQEKPFRLRVVSPATPAALGWVRAATPRVGITFDAPAPGGTASALQPNDQVVLLWDRERSADWPAAWSATMPRDPAQLGPDEVLVCTQNRSGVWWVLIAAPDEDLLRQAYEALLTTDSDGYNSRPGALVSWRVRPWLTVASDMAAARAWLKAVQPEHERFRCLPLEPLPADRLPTPPDSLVALTYRDWQGLAPDRQEYLRQILPTAVREALDSGDTHRVVTAAQGAGESRRVAAVAPASRFLQTVLPCAAGRRDSPSVPEELRRIALRTTGDQGGAANLCDLSGMPRALVIAAALNRADEAFAVDLTLRTRTALLPVGRWQFVDNAAFERSVRQQLIEGGFRAIGLPNADALILARLHTVEPRTEYERGPERCLTPKPDIVEQILDGMAAKQENRPPKVETMPVEWALSLVAREVVTLTMSLEVYDRQGTLLQSLPVRSVTTHETSTESRRATVKGFQSHPEPVRLPATTDRVTAGVENQAKANAAAEMANALAMSAVLPVDAPAPPPGGGRSSGRMVTVDGVGQADNPADARKQAIHDALRLAVEQVVGTYLRSETLAEQYELLKDKIFLHAEGFARLQRVVREQTEGAAVRVTCEVVVEKKPIREQLVALGLLRLWRVMIVVPERHLTRDVPDPAAENALMGQFVESGLPVIDQKHSVELRGKRDVLAAIEGNPEAARRLALQYQAEILVTGEAFSQDAGTEAGQRVCRARLELKAIELNTAEILAAADEHASGSDQTSELAGKVALRKAAEAIADRFIKAILRRPMPAQGVARVEVEVAGLKSYREADQVQKYLEGLPYVKEVRSKSFAAGHLRVEVELDISRTKDLPVALDAPEAMAELGLAVDEVTTGTIRVKAHAR